MDFNQRLSKIRLDIAASPFKPDHWDAVLKTLAAEVSASKASMHMHEFKVDIWSKHVAGARLHSVGYDPAAALVYREYYALQDPYIEGIRNRGPGTGIGTSDVLISSRDLEKSEFYAGYGRPNGIFYVIWMVIEQNERFASGLAMIRPKTYKQFSQDEVSILENLAPNLEQAFAHERILKRMTGGFTRMFESVDKAGIAVMGLDQRGHPINISASAKRLLDMNDPVRLRKGRITAIDPKHNIALSSAIDSAGSVWKESHEFHESRLRLPRRDGRTFVEIFVQPFSPAFDCVVSETSLFADDKPPIVMYLHESRTEIGSNALSKSLQKPFTPTEMRIGFFLAQRGLSQDEIAERLKTTAGTIRQHLQRMYRKAGISGPGSQVKLVRLLLAESKQPDSSAPETNSQMVSRQNT